MNQIRIYYEDTDASGRVYHSNYFKFLERGRSDFIYNLGYNHKDILKKYNIIFVVKNCHIEFKKPAFFEDKIEVKTNVKNLSKVKIVFDQSIFRYNDILITAEVIVVPISLDNNISRIPDSLIKKINLKN